MAVTKVVMPKLSGPEALERMQAAKRDVKALFISGHAPESARLPDQLRASGRAFLPKPFPLDAVAAKIREILDGA